MCIAMASVTEMHISIVCMAQRWKVIKEGEAGELFWTTETNSEQIMI